MNAREMFETAVRASARNQGARLCQEAAMVRGPVTRRILGTEVTADPDGTTVPELAVVVRVRMLRYLQEQYRCPTCGARAGFKCMNHTPGLSCVARAALVVQS